MDKNYFVMYKRDNRGPTLQANTHKRELYDKAEQFNTVQEAYSFAFQRMHELPIIAKSFTSEIGEHDKVRDENTPYVIAAYFTNKYHSYCMGESDPAPTYEIERVSRNQLEEKVRQIAHEGPDQLLCGLELKLVP